MSTCTVYKNGISLGTGSIANAATSITGYTATAESGSVNRVTGTNRNVTVAITSSTHVGQSFTTRVTDDGGTTLTIADANPFAT